jgi:predicted TIM-barrel fold metal-dependent hydrolase
VRALSVENGSDWIHGLASKLKKAERMNVGAFAEAPVETLRRHVTVAPYYEEDVRAVADLIGVERVVMGSDFPHAEGLEEPIRFLDELKDFSANDTRRVMRENGRDLLSTWV